MMTTPGLILSAPASGAGKTVLTLAITRALQKRGLRVALAKSGPDYIDTAFHAAVTRRPAINLDAWAMPAAMIRALAADAGRDADIVLCEGAMGLFDGVLVDGRADVGSTADLAALLGWPVVLALDVRGQGASAAALVRGFAGHRSDVHIAGVIGNHVASERHGALVRAALAELPGPPLLGLVARDARLTLPERHLGLVQAGEHPALQAFLDAAAARIEDAIDLDALVALARPARIRAGVASLLPPPGQRVAIARDQAFAFAYDWLLGGWRAKGCELAPFSPLADEAPDARADAVYLPGGYPELHAGRLAANAAFRDGLRAAAERGAQVYGECGGYMALGAALIDATGARHAMAGLLPLVSSFAERKLHLGYRSAAALAAFPFGGAGARFRGHEFHYATVVEEGAGAPLFALSDAAGAALPAAGRIARQGQGLVAGSFLHVIAPESLSATRA